MSINKRSANERFAPSWMLKIPSLPFIGILPLIVLYLAASQATSILARSNSDKHSSLADHAKTSSRTRFAAIPAEKGAHDLVSSWCSAYRQSDPERLVALETGEIEIVDRFGDWHHLIGLKDREGFWEDGFDMIRRKDFHPACTVEYVRLIRSDVAIVQATVSYNQGIALKGDDRIPPFSEIHTFVLVKAEDTWLISAQNIVQQNFGELRPGAPCSE